MIREGKIGVQEAVWLTTIAIAAKVFFTSPSALAGLVGTAGWYMTLLSALVALVGFFFIYRLLKRFPGKDLIEIYELSLGRLPGFAFSGILAVYLLFKAATRIAEFSEVTKVYVYPLSPNWFIVGIYIACIFTLCMLGLESIARFSKLIIHFMLFGIVGLLVLNVQNYHVNYLYPILGYGMDQMLRNGVLRSSVYGEVILLAIFAGSLQGTKYIKKEGIISIILAAVLISACLLAYTLSFPYYTAREITAPMYEMATLIDYGRFLQRVEPVFLFVWIISTLISTTIIFYAFLWIYLRMFRIQDKKPIVIAGTTLLYAITFLHKDVTALFDHVQWLRDYGSLFVFAVPPVALAAAALRRKGAGSGA